MCSTRGLFQSPKFKYSTIVPNSQNQNHFKYMYVAYIMTFKLKTYIFDYIQCTCIGCMCIDAFTIYHHSTPSSTSSSSPYRSLGPFTPTRPFVSSNLHSSVHPFIHSFIPPQSQPTNPKFLLYLFRKN